VGDNLSLPLIIITMEEKEKVNRKFLIGVIIFAALVVWEIINQYR